MDPSELIDWPPAQLSRLLKSLSYRQREVLKLVSGVGDGFQYTPKEVAQIFRVSEKHMNAIIRSAMSTLKRRISEASNQPIAPNSNDCGLRVSITIPEFCDEQFIADNLVELYVALNDMHLGAGGAGLIVNDGQSCAGSIAVDGAPVQ